MSETSLKRRLETELAETSKRLLASDNAPDILRHLSDGLSRLLGGASVTAVAFVDDATERDDLHWPKELRDCIVYDQISPETAPWSGPPAQAPKWLAREPEAERFGMTRVDGRRMEAGGQVVGFVIFGIVGEIDASASEAADIWLSQAASALAVLKLSTQLKDSVAIQESMTSGLIVVDRAGAITSANSSAHELLGVEELVGLSLEQCCHRLSKRIKLDTSAERIISVATTGRQLTTYGVISGDDQPAHVQLIISPLSGGSESARSLLTIRDVSPLIEKTVEANEATGRAQRHTRELTEMQDLAELTSVFGFEIDEIYNKFMSKLASLLQSSQGAIYLYQPARQRLHMRAGHKQSEPREVELGANLPVAKSFLTKRPINIKEEGRYELLMPISVHSKVLGVVTVSGRATPYTDHDLRLISLVTARLAILVENARLYHDVNARRERWEAVFQFTEEGIVIFDRKGLVVGFNPASTRLTKYSPREAIGQHFNRVVRIITTDGQNLAHLTPINQVLNEAKTLTKIEQLIETKSGERTWVESSYSPIFDNAGRVTSGIAIMRNIQKDREVEEIKSDFISIVSHELRTPLSAIKGFLDMILKKDFGSLNDKQFHYLTRVYQSNQRMIDLVEDLLDVSYIESGKINLNQNPLAPEGIITDVVTELASKGFEKQITLRVNRKQRLPLVLADETRLRQILVNLVDNAIKYSFPKSEVMIDFKVQGDDLITSVTDSGVGLSVGQVDRIFQKFGRIYNPMSIQAGGTGLGLYIVKRLVESHGGRIWVSTRGEGKGSRFSFSLPIAKQLPLI